MADELVLLETVSGMMEAEILRGLLHSRGVEVWLSHESAGTVFGLGVGPLAQVDLLVRPNDETVAREVLEQYHSGALDQDE